MPSMRLNTQAAAAVADPTEWTTVAKAKKKPKQEEDSPAPAPAKASATKNSNGRANGTTLAVAARAQVPASRQYQPDELGFEVLAAYDQTWACTSPTPAKNGKAPEPAPVLPKPTEAVERSEPQPQDGAQQPAKESKSAKNRKKAKAKQIAAAQKMDDEGQAVENVQNNGSSTAALNGKNTAAPVESKGSNGQATKNGKTGAKSRSMPKPQATVAAASSVVDLGELEAHVAGVKAKHPGDGLLLLQLLATWLARAFSAISYHLPAAIEKLGSVAASVQEPWADVNPGLQKALLQYAGECEDEHAAMYIVRVCEQTIASLPEKGGAPNDVAELLVLAAVLRAAPLGLALASTPLCSLRSKILSPGRVPVTLWMLGQAASSGGKGAACAINAWSRVVLPTITYQEVTLTAKPPKKAAKVNPSKPLKPISVYHIEPSARDTALAFLSTALLADGQSVHRGALMAAAQQGLPVGADGAMLPVVPPSAVASADAAASGALATARGTAAAVEAIRGDLAELCDSCAAPAAVASAVSRALAAADSGDRSADEAAAALLVSQLARHGNAAADAWVRAHRNSLGGSTAILESFVDNRRVLSPLLAKAHGNDTLLRCLEGIDKTQASILENQKVTPARALAARSKNALQEISVTSVSVVPASAKWSLLSIGALTLGFVAYSNFDPATVQSLLGPAIGERRATVITDTCSHARESLMWVISGMWEWWTGDSE